MKIGDKIELCSCLLPGGKMHITAIQDDHTCAYCNHFVVHKIADEVDVGKWRTYKKRLEVYKKEAVALKVKELRIKHFLN
jgi:hypothetical protein